MTDSGPDQAAGPYGSYPRPLRRRKAWTSLDGTWDFAHDDSDVGMVERWFEPAGAASRDALTRRIEVPYPPESPASGIGDTGFHPIVWYRRTLPAELTADLAGGHRLHVHFGAVDHRAQVWCDGRLVAQHVGGQTPFTADVTEALDPAADTHVLVVRAEDPPEDLEVPRGKQDWREEPHGIWYDRTTGIWQTVWCETVPAVHVADLAWTPDLATATVHTEVTLAGRAVPGTSVQVVLRLDGDVLARLSTDVPAGTAGGTRVARFDVPVDALRNGQERARLLWTPDNPTLLDAEVVVRDAAGEVLDEVRSYVGLRSVGVGGGSFLLNGQPFYLRSVLDQGFRPETLLASHGSEELRAEVETIKAMGFNSVRVHQKAEDPRFLHWADRLGLLVWGETASPYAWSPEAASTLTTEWLDLVRRDRSHPCVVAWVPINESWGVQDIAVQPAQQEFARGIAALTRSLDPSRPVMSNEGWEHVDSDVLGVHDYTVDPALLAAHYSDRAAVAGTVLRGHGPQGRRVVLTTAQEQAFLEGRAPLMVTEFGGISLSQEARSWGYGQVESAAEYAALLQRLFAALRTSSEVVGFCYTQYMDTGQETNGLLFADGKPKIPVETIRRIVTGAADGEVDDGGSTFGWAD